MTHFNIEQITDQPDRIYVEIDHRFNIVLERCEDSLAPHTPLMRILCHLARQHGWHRTRR